MTSGTVDFSSGPQASSSQQDHSELYDWSTMLPSPDLSQMDWSTDPSFGNLDLGDSGLNLDSKLTDMFNQNSQPTPEPSQASSSSSLVLDHMNSLPATSGPTHHSSNNSTGLRTPSVHGSEPDLTALGLGGDSTVSVDPANEMDMSDWLDVIMPSTSQTWVSGPVTSTTTHMQTSDPILTPRTQDVFDIFNFDDQDFGSVSMSWDKVVESGTSS